MTVRLDRLQAAIVAALAAAVSGATVLWGASEYPREAAAETLLQARIVAGPSITVSSHDTRRLPTSVRFSITEAVEGEAIVLCASGLRWEYVVQADDTTEIIRDALLELVGEEPMISATFSAVSVGEEDPVPAIDVEADELGDLWDVSVGAGSAEVEVLESTIAEVEFGDVVTLVEIQAYSQNRYPTGGAMTALSRFLSRCRLSSIRAIFDAYGVSPQDASVEPINLDALSGPAWQSRSAVSIRFAQAYVAAEPALIIETVQFGLTVKNGATAILVEGEVSSS